AVLPTRKDRLAHLDVYIPRHVLHLENVALAGTCDNTQSIRAADLTNDRADPGLAECDQTHLTSKRTNLYDPPDQTALHHNGHIELDALETAPVYDGGIAPDRRIT